MIIEIRVDLVIKLKIDQINIERYIGNMLTEQWASNWEQKTHNEGSVQKDENEFLVADERGSEGRANGTVLYGVFYFIVRVW